jgi:hypothetical protein
MRSRPISLTVDHALKRPIVGMLDQAMPDRVIRTYNHFIYFNAQLLSQWGSKDRYLDSFRADIRGFYSLANLGYFRASQATRPPRQGLLSVLCRFLHSGIVVSLGNRQDGSKTSGFLEQNLR